MVVVVVGLGGEGRWPMKVLRRGPDFKRGSVVVEEDGVEEVQRRSTTATWGWGEGKWRMLVACRGGVREGGWKVEGGGVIS